MDYKLIIRPEARSELLDIFQWYQEQRSGLGFDFKLCVDEIFSKLIKHPSIYKKYITIFAEPLRKDFRLESFISLIMTM